MLRKLYLLMRPYIYIYTPTPKKLEKQRIRHANRFHSQAMKNDQGSIVQIHTGKTYRSIYGIMAAHL